MRFDRIISSSGVGMPGRPARLQVVIYEERRLKLPKTNVTLVQKVSVTRHLILASDGTHYMGWNLETGKERAIIEYDLKPTEKHEEKAA